MRVLRAPRDEHHQRVPRAGAEARRDVEREARHRRSPCPPPPRASRTASARWSSSPSGSASRIRSMKTPISTMLASVAQADLAAAAEQHHDRCGEDADDDVGRAEAAGRCGRRGPGAARPRRRARPPPAASPRCRPRSARSRRASTRCAAAARRAAPAAVGGRRAHGASMREHLPSSVMPTRSRLHPVDRGRGGRPPARRRSERAAHRLRARPAGARAEGLLRARRCCASASATSTRRASPRCRSDELEAVFKRATGDPSLPGLDGGSRAGAVRDARRPRTTATAAACGPRRRTAPTSRSASARCRASAR